MSNVTINGKAYQCHSFKDTDIEIGHSIELIVEGSFKPRKNRAILVIRQGKEYSGSLAFYHNYEKLATLALFVEEDI